MVNSVNFGSYNNYPAPPIKESGDAAKYTYAAVNSQVKNDGPFSGMGTILGIQGLISGAAGTKWLWKNRADVSGAWKIYKDAAVKQANIFKADGGLLSKNAYQQVLKKHGENAVKAAKIQKVDKAIKNISKMSEQAKKAGMTLEEFAAKNTGKIGIFSKAGTWLKNLKPVKALGKIPGVSKIAKMGKGNGAFLAISAAIELFTQVIPTFKKLGAKAGLKQIGKSTVTTLASVGGWVAGSAVGTKAGAALGAAIGSVVPGVGTAIGGFVGATVGFMGGLLGSWLAAKAAKAVVGKNELEKAQEAGKLPANDTTLPAQEPLSLPQDVASVNNPFAANPQMPDLAYNTSNQGFNPYLFNSGNQLPYAERDFMAMTAGLD